MGFPLYLDAHIELNYLTKPDEGNIQLETNEEDEYTLDDMHTDDGYNNHDNTGCNTHSDSGYDDHSHSGYNDHDDTGCNTHYHVGCNTHTDTGYDDHSHTYGDHYDSGYDNHNKYSQYSTYDNHDAGAYTAHSDKDTSCNTHSDYCSTHSHSGCHTHSDTGYDDLQDSGYDNHTNTGCETHSHSGCNTHSNSGYDDHVNTGCSTHLNYTDNFDPELSGVVSPSADIYNDTIPLSWPEATNTLADGQSDQTITYYLDYRRRDLGATTWGEWTDLTSTTSTSYNWDVSGITAGEYQVNVIAYDGLEYSDNTLESEVFQVIFYTAPSWTTVINDDDTRYRKVDMDQLRSETNTARDSFGLATVTFTRSITANETLIQAGDITEIRDDLQEVNTEAGNSAFGWTRSSISQGITLAGVDLNDLRQVLENLSS